MLEQLTYVSPMINQRRNPGSLDMPKTIVQCVLFPMIIIGSGTVSLGSPPLQDQSNLQHNKENKGMIWLKIDHVTIAGSSLASLRDAFARIDLATEYGGAHSNGLTHMALLGFDDGSYIELASTVKPGETNIPVWAEHIRGNGGPCAWAVSALDVAAEAKRIASIGVSVQGPFPGGRKRPDGTQVSWKLIFAGDQPVGAVLPFYIEDVTPRTNRVQPSASVSKTELTGVAAVILAVHDLEVSVAQFRRVYHWVEPRRATDDKFGARLAYFPDTPVILATPNSAGNWLSVRLARFGESPVAILIRSQDLEASLQRFKLTTEQKWFGHRVAWFDQSLTLGTRLGLIE